MPLASWQKLGNEKGSTVSAHPSDDTILGWARELLDIPRAAEVVRRVCVAHLVQDPMPGGASR